MFKLGNYNVDEILYAVAQDFSGNILYTVDQLSSASIEVSSESTDYTDKRGNIVRTVYKNKTATFTSTSAFLHPAIQNAGSGSEIEYASADNAIEMPKIEIVPAGGSITLENPVEGSVKAIGLFGNGANDKALAQSTTASYEAGTFGLVGTKVTVPAAGEDMPVQYLVTYDRSVESGMKLSNTVTKFPDAVKLTLYVSIMDPCSDKLRAAYVVIPNFMADPNMTFSLDSESQEVDFNGNINSDYCSGNKVLYYVMFPDEDVVISGVTE